jgi:hypothetical protein
MKLYEYINFNDIDNIDSETNISIEDLPSDNIYCWYVRMVDNISYYEKLYNDLLGDLDGGEREEMFSRLMKIINPINNKYMMGDKFVLYYEPLSNKKFDWDLYGDGELFYKNVKCLGELDGWLYGQK